MDRRQVFRAPARLSSRNEFGSGSDRNDDKGFGTSSGSGSQSSGSMFQQDSPDSGNRDFDNDDKSNSSGDNNDGGNGGGNNGNNSGSSGNNGGSSGNNGGSSGNNGNNGVNGGSGVGNGNSGNGGNSGGSGNGSPGFGGSSSSGDDKSNPFGGGGGDNSNSFGGGFCPFCVNDNDPRVLYEGPWVLSGNGTGPFVDTEHETTTSGSKASLIFKGSGIVVFGTVPTSNDTVLPPTVNYTIDAAEPFTTAQPFASDHIKHQPLFAVSQLNDSEHQIEIEVLNASAPYLLDYFFIFPHANFTQTSVDGPPSFTPRTPPTISGGSTSSPVSGIQSTGEVVSATTLKAISAVLGTLVVILSLACLLLVFRLRRLRKTQQFGLPRYAAYASSFTSISKNNDGPWSRSMSPVLSEIPRPETIFTSTESIMRNYPSTLGGRSTYSRPSVGPTSSSQANAPLPAPLPTRSSPPPSPVQRNLETTRLDPDPLEVADRSHLSLSP